MKLRNALVAGVLGVAVLAAGGCGGGDSGSSDVEASEGTPATTAGDNTLVMLVNSMPDNLDVNPWNGIGSALVMNGLASQLVRYDGGDLPGGGCEQPPTGANIVPWLAKSIELSEDEKKVTIVLNEFKSPAGNTLSADDVKWSFERDLLIDDTGYDGWIDAGYVVPKEPTFGKKSVDSSMMITVVDDRTVELHVKQANAHTIELLANNLMMIYDSTEAKKHATKSDPYADDWLDDHIADYSGWELETFTPGTDLILTANPDWGGPDRGNVTRLVVRGVPESATREQLLSTGEADIVTGLEYDQYKRVSETPGVSVTQCAGYARDLLVLQSERPPLDDQRVRQAISMAIDRETLASAVYNGYATPSQSAFPSGLGFELPDNAYTFDPERAKQLLAEAGADGMELTISYSTTRPGVVVRKSSVLLQSMLTDVGIDVKLREVVNPADLYTAWTERNYQAMLYSDAPPITDPAFYGRVWFHSDAPNNTTGFASEEYDKLLDELKATPLSEGDKRNELLTRMAEITNEYSGLLALVEPANLAASSDSVEPFVMTPNGYIRFHELSMK